MCFKGSCVLRETNVKGGRKTISTHKQEKVVTLEDDSSTLSDKN